MLIIMECRGCVEVRSSDVPRRMSSVCSFIVIAFALFAFDTSGSRNGVEGGKHAGGIQEGRRNEESRAGEEEVLLVRVREAAGERGRCSHPTRCPVIFQSAARARPCNRAVMSTGRCATMCVPRGSHIRGRFPADECVMHAWDE